MRRVRWCARDLTRSDPKDAHETGDVLYGLHAEVVEGQRTISNLVVSFSGDVNASGLCQAFQPRRDIHAGAEYIVTLADDVADIDADAKLDPLLRRVCIPQPQLFLNFSSAEHAFHYTWKLDKEAVAHRSEDVSAMRGNSRFDDARSDLFQSRECALFVGLHQAAIADHVRNENCREASLGFFAGDNVEAGHDASRRGG